MRQSPANVILLEKKKTNNTFLVAPNNTKLVLQKEFRALNLQRVTDASLQQEGSEMPFISCSLLRVKLRAAAGPELWTLSSLTPQRTTAEPESSSPAKYVGEISARGQSVFHTQMPFYLPDPEIVASLWDVFTTLSGSTSPAPRQGQEGRVWEVAD